MKRPLLLALATALAVVEIAASATSPPRAYIASSALDGSDVRILSGDEAATTPVPAADGRIAFGRYESGVVTLWVIDADGTGARRVAETDPDAFGDPTWSPTGDALALTAWDASPCYPWSHNCAISEIRVHDVLTGEIRGRLRSAQRGGYAHSWAPDGRRIAHLGESDFGFSAYTVEVTNTDGTGRRVLVRTEYPQWLTEIAWSPRGDWIAYVQRRWIWLVRPTGGPPRRVAKGDRLLWSPRGRLLYSVDRTRRLLDPATGRSRTLLTAPAYIASWSPDGARLAYRAAYANGVTTVAVARASDGRVVSRARVAGKVTDLHFHAGGTRLLYGIWLEG